MMEAVPDRVVAFPSMFQGKSRVIILRHLLDRAMKFPQLRKKVVMSTATLREGINDLEAAGCVVDDSPATVRRRPTSGVFSVDRTKLMTDLAETIHFLAIWIPRNCLLQELSSNSSRFRSILEAQIGNDI